MGCSYLTTIPGIIKIIEEVFNLVAFLCVVCHDWTTTRGNAFIAASIGAFLITGIITILHIFGVGDKKKAFIIVQFIYCIVWAVFYLITSALVIDWGKDFNDSYIAGGVFGLLALITYLVDAYFTYKEQP